jgi:hypothetical protein
MDGINGYNNANRLFGLCEVMDKHPLMMPFLKKIYGGKSNGWFFGLSEDEKSVRSIDSVEGFHQGDVLGGWLYAMSIHPFIKEIDSIFKEDGLVKFYIDDGNIGGSFGKMCEAIALIKQEGPKFGYYLNMKKGSYTLGKCRSTDEAIQRKATLVSLGLAEEIIHIHPDNDPNTKDRYGLPVLGSFVGSAEFIAEQLKGKVKELKEEADAIVLKVAHWKQVQLLLLRWCFCQKLTYWQRTLPPSAMEGIVEQFSDLKKHILCSILGRSRVDRKFWCLAQLPVSDGGLGLNDSVQVSHAAYVSSFLGNVSKIQAIFPSGNVLDQDVFSIQELKKSIEFIKSFDTDVSIDSLLKSLHERSFHSNSFQNLLSDKFTSANKKEVEGLMNSP